MNRFDFEWMAEALDQVAQIWVDANLRNKITSAVAAIDLRLCDDPLANGVELHEGLRKLVEPPLHVIYEVSEANRLVMVV